MFFESDQVFYAKVLKREYVGGDDDIQDIRFTLQVERVFKGTAKPTEVVVTENSSGRWLADPGERRMVFAREGQVGGLCSPIDEPRHARETMRAIRDLAKAKHAKVEGEVRSWLDGSPVAGVKVRIAGSGGTREATTDRNGYFSAQVEPGRYRLILPEDLGPAEPYSRSDTDGFALVRGQCAQFLLIPVR